MSETPATNSNGESTTADTVEADQAEALQGLHSLASELGLTPGQIKGRLEASRKWEDRAKANANAAKELEAAKQAAMTDQEKAVAEAVAKARAEVMTEVGSSLVDANFKAAAAGRSVDVEALLEGLDRAKFLTEDGKPDTEAITSWIDRIAPQQDQEPARPSFPDLGQGQRGTKDMALNGDPLLRDLKAKLRIN